MASGVCGLPPSQGEIFHQKMKETTKFLQKLGQSPSSVSESEEMLRDQEQNILELGEKYREEGKATEMSHLIKQVRPFLKYISKAKAAKLVRGLVDMFLDMERITQKGEAEVQLCQECIEWAKDERRIFLRQSLEARLIGLYFDTEQYSEALTLEARLLKELK
eukprot:maker-scaffold514_size150699-snap-gene-0.29 protein:Tk01736 transcript:maker-scaffold514_size150699-snap-gene-0.29-mRNA-1 annotation:"tpa_inf: 26s proteasome regulatory complex component"